MFANPMEELVSFVGSTVLVRALVEKEASIRHL
jgi:hypothetical protein